MQLYKNLSPYPHYYALKNGAFISHDFGAGPLSDEYRYYILIHMEMKPLVLDLRSMIKILMENMTKVMSMYLTM